MIVNTWFNKLFCFLIPLLVYSQSNNDFFGSDFNVRDTFGNQKITPSPTPQSTPSIKVTPEPQASIQQEEQDVFNSTDSSEKKYKITKIGIIVSVVDQENANLYMDNLINTAISHDLEVGDLIMIGSPFYQLSRKDHSKFLVRGGNVIAGSEPPAKYKDIKTSPAYILSGPEGDIILETTKDPDKFITSDNYYIEQQKYIK